MKAINAVMGLFGYVPFDALVEAERDALKLDAENANLARRLKSLDEAHSQRLHALQEAKEETRRLRAGVTCIRDTQIVEFCANGSVKPTRLELIVSTVRSGVQRDTILASRVYNKKNHNELANLANSLRHHKPV
jgi:hypothetical protein